MSDEHLGRILVVDDEPALREMLQVLLRRAGFDATVVNGVEAAQVTLASSPSFDAVLTDLLMPDGTGLDVLELTKQNDVSTQVVLFTAHATTERAVEAMRKGAYDYLEKPFQNSVLIATLEKAVEKRRILVENAALRDRLHGGGRRLVGLSASMVNLRALIQRAASARTSVLVTGESGTGKELVARALHDQGPRSAGPFVVVNCGALPESLMESELFGHEKGAFTGASQAKDGLFRAANGGTIFLDELGELPLPLQVKLLRVLQERKVRRVGGSKELATDARVVAATNRDLEDEVQEGRFREDLFYRLNVIRLPLPSLRERPEDVRPLAEHLLAKHNALQERSLKFLPEALAWLSRQDFPGNVRELENRIERAVALAVTDTIDVEDLGGGGAVLSTRVPGVAVPDLEEGFDLDAHLAAIEHAILLQALEKNGGVRKRAAKFLNMTFRSFRYRLAKYDLGPD
jgi:two-component system response regulator PilR (NtrC family)